MIVNARMVLFVAMIIVLQPGIFQALPIVVQLRNRKVYIHALVPVEVLERKVMTIAMMKTTIVDVNGMEETVVVVISIQNIVQIVNV